MANCDLMSKRKNPEPEKVPQEAISAVVDARDALEAAEPGSNFLGATPEELKELGVHVQAALERADRALEKVPEEVIHGNVIAAMRYLMGMSGMNQAELSRRSGLSTTIINRILKKTRRPTIRQIAALANTFGVEITALLDGSFGFGFGAKPKPTPEQRALHSQRPSPAALAAFLEGRVEGEGLQDHGPDSLVVFLQANDYRLTPEEKKMLVSVGSRFTDGADPGEKYWLGFLRLFRRAQNWPPPAAPGEE